MTLPHIGNVTRLEALADRLAHLDPQMLDFTTWGQRYQEDGKLDEYDPNSPACVGAWAVRMFGEPRKVEGLYATPHNGLAIAEYARQLLGLTVRQAVSLFFLLANPSPRVIRHIPAGDAAQAVRNLTCTGRPWVNRRPGILGVLRDEVLLHVFMAGLWVRYRTTRSGLLPSSRPAVVGGEYAVPEVS